MDLIENFIMGVATIIGLLLPVLIVFTGLIFIPKITICFMVILWVCIIGECANK